MRKLALVPVIVMLCGTVAFSQDRAEVFGGYQFTRFNPGDVNFNGWNAALTAYPGGHWLGLTADVSGVYRSGVKVHSFLFGPTLSPNHGGSIAPFVHALFGAAHISDGGSDTAFGMALGGGLDLKVLPLISVRVGQADYFMTRFGGETQNNARISAGVVLHF
jgi:hypothetical protein